MGFIFFVVEDAQSLLFLNVTTLQQVHIASDSATSGRQALIFLFHSEHAIRVVNFHHCGRYDCESHITTHHTRNDHTNPLSILKIILSLRQFKIPWDPNTTRLTTHHTSKY